MSVCLTQEQARAVEARGNVIVSASAGSGKTFVMIERLVSLVLSGTDVRNILAVTFTNKAAAQMRDRLRKALLDGIGNAEGAARERLKAQLADLPLAEISTIHAFCARLVRTYFYAAGVDPAFRVVGQDDAACMELASRAMDQVFEEMYEEGSEAFKGLLSVYFRKKKDDALKAVVREIHAKARGLADYREKLAAMGGADAFAEVCASLFSGYAARLAVVREGLASRAGQYAALGEKAVSAAEALVGACDALSGADGLFGMKAAAEALPPFARTPVKRNATAEERAALGYLSGARKEIRSVADELAGYASAEEEHARYLDANARAAALGQLVLAYDGVYAAEKREAGVLDYNDLEQFALALLEGRGLAGKSEEESRALSAHIRAELRAKYSAVFVDEYQDVNPVQDRLLTALGGDEVFFVGDAKQAIYGFRGSNSQFFEEKERTLPVSLRLSSNFRSAPAVLEAVNRVFSAVLPGYVPMQGGERYGAHAGEVKFHIVAKEKREKEAPEEVYSVLEHTGRIRRDALAERVADLVEEELGGGTWYDADEKDEAKREKPVAFGDIAVLTRRRAGEAEKIVYALADRGIPVSTAAEVNICEFFEARLVLDWLFYLDNPEQDIPFVTALLSAAGGFTEAELAAVRARFAGAGARPFREVFRAYLSAEDDGISRKGKAFFMLAEKLRAHSRIRTAEEVMGELLALGLEAQIAAKEGGASRLARVRRLAAEGAETDVHTFLARLRATGFRLGFSESGGEGAVRVVTMHASKGLEYPVVILAGTDVRFRGGEERDEVLFTERCLAAPRSYDVKNKLVYGTVLRRAAARATLEEERKQERNLLYVGMTRARFRLHVLFKEGSSSALSPAFATSIADFFDFAALADYFAPAAESSRAPACRRALVWQPDAEKTERILAVYRRPYAFAASVALPVKSSATALLGEKGHTHVRETEPDGAPASGLVPEEDVSTSREAGIAYHAFLQYVEFGRGGAEERARMAREGVLPPETLALLDDGQLGRILALPCLAALAGKPVRREQTFLVSLQADETGLADTADEIVFQGAIDLLCADEAGYIVIDYKYSALSDDALREKYAVQIALYKKAVARVMRVDERTIRARIVNIARCREIAM